MIHEQKWKIWLRTLITFFAWPANSLLLSYFVNSPAIESGTSITIRPRPIPLHGIEPGYQLGFLIFLLTLESFQGGKEEAQRIWVASIILWPLNYLFWKWFSQSSSLALLAVSVLENPTTPEKARSGASKMKDVGTCLLLRSLYCFWNWEYEVNRIKK